MKKEELESLFRRGDEVPDFGSIEIYLHTLATEPQLPDLAIGVCAVRIEEAAPALRAVLARAADGDELSEDEANLLFRGLHILGGARDLEACQPLLRLLRRPIDDIHFLLGDAITESLAKITAGVFDGDVDALFGAIVDRSLNEFIRAALLGAATLLAWDGQIERGRMQQFLADFYGQRLADDDDYVWIGWLESIALLGLRVLAPLVHSAWDEGRIPEGVLERRHFEQDLAEAERAPADLSRFNQANLGYIDDVLESLDWCRHRESAADSEFQEPLLTDLAPPMVPFINPMRNVGRNDPCPCGSGKKAKKCCLVS
ncbi:MAG TPA: DUF1186 domain-containing protein [Beijerinckiaceae bacterium]|nr:DUF1186 domain-containing protein [Beijerinckiaceae bacterium]